MHTKKANVAKEELEAIQSRQRIQQNRQLGDNAPLPPTDIGYPQQGGDNAPLPPNMGYSQQGVRQPQYLGNAGQPGHFQQPGMNQGYGQVPRSQGQQGKLNIILYFCWLCVE